MPVVKLPSGSVHEVPSHGQHRLIEQHMRNDGTRRFSEFTFNMDTGIVRSDTFEDKLGWMAGPNEPPARPRHIGGGERPIEDYLHGPQNMYNEPKMAHWTARTPEEEEYRQKEKKRRFEELYNSPIPSRRPVQKVPKMVWPMYGTMDGRHEKGDNMPQLTTGTRVQIPDPTGQDKYAYGTVVELKEGVPKGCELLCMDKPHPDYQDASTVVGPDHGLVTSHSNMRMMQVRSRTGMYEGVPPHIGMFNPEPFTYQSVEFPRNSLGRVIKVEKETATLTWLNVKQLRHDKFHVPLDYLRWCRYDPETNKIKNMWYSTHSPLKEGEVLVYWSDKPCQIGGRNDMHAVTRGVLLRHRGLDPDRCCINAEVVAGMDTDAIGQIARVRKQDVRKFEEPFIPRGQEVEVVAEILFRKKSLQGRKGRVILATDFEGDVGIEFPEDIGAGSLDGAGTEGRCLYVPADSVRETE